MKVRGAIHAHTDLSHDGTLTVAQLAHWYRSHGYQFIAITEHSQDMTSEKVKRLHEQAQAESDANFLVIPGTEYTCRDKIHIPAIGVTALIASDDPCVVAAESRRLGGFTVLAHPRRIGWQCSAELLAAVDAVELWNVGYDGKFVPSPEGLDRFPKMRASRPDLLAVAAHDLHRTVQFYDVALEMDLSSLARETVLAALRSGAYQIRSRFYSSDSSGHCTGAERVWYRFISSSVKAVRKLRTATQRWSA